MSILHHIEVIYRQYLCENYFNMDSRIDKLKKIRQFILKQISELTDEQLNEIPPNFNNNIAWNLAHMMCAQQGICYLRSGNAAVIDEKFIAPFFTNTKPERSLSAAEIAEIKTLFISTIDQLQVDFEKEIFRNYQPSPNILKVYGIEIKSIDDALEFLLYHDGYHVGTILALKKLV